VRPFSRCGRPVRQSPPASFTATAALAASSVRLSWSVGRFLTTPRCGADLPSSTWVVVTAILSSSPPFFVADGRSARPRRFAFPLREWHPIVAGGPLPRVRAVSQQRIGKSEGGFSARPTPQISISLDCSWSPRSARAGRRTLAHHARVVLLPCRRFRRLRGTRCCARHRRFSAHRPECSLLPRGIGCPGIAAAVVCVLHSPPLWSA